MLERWQTSVTVIRRAARDNYGNEQPGVEFLIHGCWLAPSMGTGQASSSETSGGLAHTVVTGSQLYLPTGSDLRSTDRVRVGGAVWEVEGDVGDWGAVGMQVGLRKVSG